MATMDIISDVINLKASITWFEVAPPPTSKKLAGLPPCNLIMSIVVFFFFFSLLYGL
jgi:hypothetical protein